MKIPEPYREFLNRHGDQLAAFSWLAYQDRGPGAVKVTLLFEPRGLEFQWIRRDNASQELGELIDSCDFEKEVVAVFADGSQVSFMPLSPPPDSFKKYKKFLTIGGGVVFWRISNKERTC